ncbi:hypothetical protein NDA18_003464 [Ustilago nuda]|nr:hypothetical protein NDA18_003464 [Ustilago nuda]
MSVNTSIKINSASSCPGNGASTSKAVLETLTSNAASSTSAAESNDNLTASPAKTHPQYSQLQVSLEQYTGEHQMPSLISLIESELSEPYIVYTYRYFVNQWPDLCFLAISPCASREGHSKLNTNFSGGEAIGCIVCKLDRHQKGSRLVRGYIAMISVASPHRGRRVAKRLVCKAIQQMVAKGAQEIVLETEADNKAALALYEGLGFVREKRLHRFYLNGKDSFRLVLPIPKSMQNPIVEGFDGPPPNRLVQPPYLPSYISSQAESHEIAPAEHSMSNDYFL